MPDVELSTPGAKYQREKEYEVRCFQHRKVFNYKWNVNMHSNIDNDWYVFKCMLEPILVLGLRGGLT